MSEDVSAGKLLLEVVADTTGLRADLKAKLDALSRDIKAQVKAQLVLDAEQARAEIKAATRDQVIKVRAEADTAAAKADLDKAAADRTVKIKAKADTAEARTELDGLARTRTTTIKAKTDKASFEKAAADFGEKLTSVSIPTFIGSGIAAGIGAAGQLAGALVAVAAAGAQAVGVVGALPGLMLAAAQAAGSVKLGFSGITAAVSAYSARQATAGADAITSAQQIRAAQDQVRTSAQSLLNAQIGGAQQAAQAQHAYQQAVIAVADAQYNAGQSVAAALHAQQQAIIAVSDAQYNASQSTGNALHAERQAIIAVSDARYNAAQTATTSEHSYASALFTEQQAQIALTQARLDARQNLIQTAFDLRGAVLGEKQAALSLTAAAIKLRETNQSAAATPQMRAQALLDYQQAQLQQAESINKAQQAAAAKKKADRLGVGGSQQVVQARHAEKDAAYSLQQAEQAVTRARLEATRSIKEAEYQLQQSVQAYARAQVLAVRSVISAQYQEAQSVQAYARARIEAARAVANAEYQQSQAAQTISNDRRTSSQQLLNAQISYREALLAAKSPLLGVSSAQTALNKAMGLLTPAGRALVRFIDSTLIPKYRELQKATATALLPGVTAGLRSALPVIGTIRGGLKGTAGVLGTVASRFGSWLGSAAVNSDLSGLMSTNTRAIGKFGDAALHVVDAIRNIAVVAEPLVLRIAAFADRAAKIADSMTRTGRASGGLARFFDDAWKSAVQLGKITGNLLTAIGHLFGAAAPSGSSLLGSLVLATKKLSDWTGSSGGQAKMAKFFQNTIPVARQFGDLLVKAAGIIIKLVSSFGGGQLNGLFSVLNLALTILSTLTRLPGFAQLVQWILVLSGAGAGLGFVAGKIGAIGKGLAALTKITGLNKLSKALGFGDTVGAGFKNLGGKLLGTKATAATVGKDGAAVAATAATGLRGAAASAGAWLSGAFSAAGTAAGAMAGKIGTALSTAKTALADGATAAAGWASGFASSMGSAIGSGAKFVAGLGVQLAQGARSLVVFVAEQATVAAAFIAENIAMAVAATAAFVAENAATLGIVAVLAVLIGAIVYTATHWQQVWGTIKHWAEEAWNFIYNGIGKYLLVLLGPAGLILLGIIEVSKHWTQIWSDIKHWAADAWNFIYNGIGQYLLILLGPAGLIIAGIIEVSKHWSSIWSTIKSVVADAWKFIQKGTSDLVTGLKTTWDKIRQVFEAPVKFIVNTVYDNGIAKIWNWVASKLGMPTLPTLKLAAGGRVPGTGRGDHVPALLEPQERVLSRKQVASFGGGSLAAGHTALDGMVGRGGSAGPGYQAGGIIDWFGGLPGDIGHAIASGVSGAWDAAKFLAQLTANPVGTATHLLDAALGGWAKLGSSPVVKMIEAVPKKFVSAGIETIKNFLGLGGGAGGTKVTPPVITGSVAQWFAKAVQLTGVPTTWIPPLEVIAQYESSDNPTAINLTDCLTLDYVILTKRGWLRHDQVRVGDETIGYNPETQKAEWTRVTRVVRYEDAEIWRIGNGHWHADVTPNHRWWSDTLTRVQPVMEDCPECGWKPRSTKQPSKGVQVHRSRIHGIYTTRAPLETLRGEFVRTDGLHAGHRLRLAALAQTDGIPGLSLQDARIIAWLQGDGTITRAIANPSTVLSCPDCGWKPGDYRGRATDRPAEAVAVHRAKKHGTVLQQEAGVDVGWDGRIWQSKPAQVERLRKLLASVPHHEASRGRRGRDDHFESFAFTLRREFVTDLLARAGVMETGPEAFVLALSPEQRAAWLDAMIDAEGNRQRIDAAGDRRGGSGEFVRITQVDGPLQEAIKLAVYLEGYRPTFSRLKAHERGYQPSGNVGMARPHIAPSMFNPPQVLERQPVFCVSTELGSWTAKGGDALPFLTGNSNAAAGDPSRGLLTYAGHHDHVSGFSPVWY